MSLESLFRCTDMAESLQLSLGLTVGMTSLDIIEIVRGQLTGCGESFTKESICALMETIRLQSHDYGDLEVLLHYLEDIGASASVYRSVCLVLMAQIAIEVLSERGVSRDLLNKVNPLKLEQVPPVFLVRCYLLKAASTDAGDLTQRDRLLSKGLEHFERSKEAMSIGQRTRLEFKLRYQRCKVLLEEEKYSACLSLSIENLEGYPCNVDYFSESGEFLENFDNVVRLLLYVPYCSAKVDSLRRFAKLIGCDGFDDDYDKGLRKWLEDHMSPEGLRNVLCELSRGQIVKLDMKGLADFLRMKFPLEEQFNQVYRNLMELDVISVASKFATVRIDTMKKLMGLKEDEDLLALIVELILDRKIAAEVDEVDGVVRFERRGREDWKGKAAEVFLLLNQIS